VVQAGDQAPPLLEGVAGAARLRHVAREDVELEAELPPELVLPLLDEASWGSHEAAIQVARIISIWW